MAGWTTRKHKVFPCSAAEALKHFASVSHMQQLCLAGCTWKFTEAAMVSKGAADSIGGVTKDLGDAAIKTRSVIEDAKYSIDVICSRTIRSNYY